MPRPRLPSRFATVLLTVRALATVLSALVIVFLLYMTIIFGKTFAWAYTAAAFAICLDTAEAATLVDKERNVPRLHWAVVLALELLVLGLHVGGCLTLAFAELAAAQSGEYDGFYSADPYRIYALATQGSVGGVHFILLILGCVEQVRVWR
ncbi:hypothetical protein MAPG_03732 [Magnaporthiopsis poae ATCC 64411]|uniref:Integral membrane protein n=1 Tax=Magnaporthiopsis poae (strain ATCC 64411 / 73-15) TaxID=644358 RepID=A0A0C4DUT9_MAGP6|nr:hypothetical protein MAPG_03732 [Magnaporthiopsis poae ATCC 64411]